MNIKNLWGSGLVLGIVGTAAGYAVTIDYADFSSVAGLQLNGNAAQAGNVLSVVPAQYYQAGSAFYQTAIPLNNLQSFSTTFEFRIVNSGGAGDSDGPGADGLTFVIARSPTALGDNGGGLGYQGIENSLAVEVDTYNNGSVDPAGGNHAGIDLNGNIASVTSVAVADPLNNGQDWFVWVDYNGTTLEVRLDETGIRPSSALLTYDVDLGGVIGQSDAFVGFTAGTGAGYGDHDILNWQFESRNGPSVPELGSTLILLALACFGLRLARRAS